VSAKGELVEHVVVVVDGESSETSPSLSSQICKQNICKQNISMQYVQVTYDNLTQKFIWACLGFTWIYFGLHGVYLDLLGLKEMQTRVRLWQTGGDVPLRTPQPTTCTLPKTEKRSSRADNWSHPILGYISLIPACLRRNFGSPVANSARITLLTRIVQVETLGLRSHPHFQVYLQPIHRQA
jgi:hypothetical protein